MKSLASLAPLGHCFAIQNLKGVGFLLYCVWGLAGFELKESRAKKAVESNTKAGHDAGLAKRLRSIILGLQGSFMLCGGSLTSHTFGRNRVQRSGVCLGVRFNDLKVHRRRMDTPSSKNTSVDKVTLSRRHSYLIMDMNCQPTASPQPHVV